MPPTISVTWSFERHLRLHTGHLSRKFTQDEVERMIEQIEQWFAAHPRRQLCRTEFFTVRRNHTREDVLAHWVSYVENDAVSESIRKSIKRHHRATR